MTKYIANIEGMMCGMCEAHTNDAVRRAFKVKKVTSSHSKNQTEIITNENITEEQLKKVIDETGYKLISLTKEPYEEKGLFSFLKK